MSEDKEARLRELIAKATPLPWHFSAYDLICCRMGAGSFVVAEPVKTVGRPAGEHTTNAFLIIEAVNGLPGLLEELARLRAALIDIEELCIAGKPRGSSPYSIAHAALYPDE